MEKHQFSYKYQNVTYIFHDRKLIEMQMSVLGTGFEMQTALACFCVTGILSPWHYM
tara:strand:+ start:8768 stop:8935 length:168 start_codon:yes stop_codon:yes gene_type:complete